MIERVSTSPVREGDIIADKYRVERWLGAGSMGVIVAAMHLQLRQRVALKLVLPHALSEPGAAERLLREARAAARLKSENVARVLDVGTLLTGAPFIVMEFLDGLNLGELLDAQGPQPFETSVSYIVQACDALTEAHAAGIIHRDLKPENLFLTRRGSGAVVVKVLDFGISKVSATEADAPPSLAIGNVGTPLYMAPEQMRSSHDVDPRADIWSLGAILFELLSGLPPFPARSYADLCVVVASGEKPRLDVLEAIAPPALIEIIGRCLKCDPAHRFQTTAELAAALEPFASPALIGRRLPSGAPPQVQDSLSAVLWDACHDRTSVTWSSSSPHRPSRRSDGMALSLALGATLLCALTLIGSLSALRQPHAQRSQATAQGAPYAAQLQVSEGAEIEIEEKSLSASEPRAPEQPPPAQPAPTLSTVTKPAKRAPRRAPRLVVPSRATQPHSRTTAVMRAPEIERRAHDEDIPRRRD